MTNNKILIVEDEFITRYGWKLGPLCFAEAKLKAFDVEGAAAFNDKLERLWPELREELAAFMKSTFAEEVDKEKQRLLEYGDIKPPAGMHIEAGNVGNYPGPVPVLSVPPAAPNSSVVTGAQTSMTGASMPDLTGSTAPVPLSQMETAMGLPQVTRQPAPPAPSSSAPTIMPRLTAAAASTTSGKEEHVATQLQQRGRTIPLRLPFVKWLGHGRCG